jgi:hypothetical protein
MVFDSATPYTIIEVENSLSYGLLGGLLLVEETILVLIGVDAAPIF